MISTASSSPRYSRILGTGSFLPADRVTNQALAELSQARAVLMELKASLFPLLPAWMAVVLMTLGSQ